MQTPQNLRNAYTPEGILPRLLLALTCTVVLMAKECPLTPYHIPSESFGAPAFLRIAQPTCASGSKTTACERITLIGVLWHMADFT